MLLKCLVHLGLRTVNELLTWEVLFQVISLNSWSILALIFFHGSQGECHYYAVWEQACLLISCFMVANEDMVFWVSSI